ncbi:MAG: glycosyltransferase family 2 protein [Patescibacteria group bacterium]|nr:glycosyltransferase family 2 protein [Patescibacteria group bacterium]
MISNIDLSIVVVSWNVKKLLRECLKSIFVRENKLNIEVIVVDNASHDGSVEMIKNEFPAIDLIPNTHNLGFAAANNQGILKSQGRYILVLNPDTVIVKDALNKMIDFMEKNYQIGIAGCKHLNPDWTVQPSVRRLPDFLPIFFIFTKLAKIFPNLPPIYYYLAKDFNYKITQPIDQVAGSFFMIRREALDEIGLFDENFFIWFEEVDLCKRANDAGWQVWYYAGAEIIHYGGQSFAQQLAIKKQRQFFKSAWYYFIKHGFYNSR